MPASAATAAREILTGLHEVMAKRGSAQAKLDKVVDLIAEALSSDVCSIYLLRESYLESTEDLKSFAEKVKQLNDAKNELRELLADLREEGSDVSGLEEQLNALGDDAQLANVDLQNVLQKQQQTMQMMSNISKTLYDTAQAVIRKFGG